MTPDEWARANRVYPKTAAIPGPRDPSLTPYIIPIERAIANRTHRRVVTVMGTQMSKSELAMDVVGHRLDTAPVPIGYIAPSQQLLKEGTEPRFTTLFRQAKSLRRKLGRGRQSKFQKRVAGVHLYLVHAGSATSLAEKSLGLVITDEVDKYRENVMGQGDAVGLADRRGDAYADFVHFSTSSPSVGMVEVELDEESGLEFWGGQDPKDLQSTIWRMWQSGTRYHWAVPCTHCGTYFIPRFRDLEWEKPKGEDGKSLPSDPYLARQTAHIVCSSCTEVLTWEDDLEEMNARGLFVAPGQRADPDGTVVGPEPQAWTLSFWVSGLCSPFVPWGQRAAEYIEAKRSGVMVNTQAVVNGLGELFAPGDGEAPEWQELNALRRTYLTMEVPEDVRVLTLACDVQKDRLVVTIRGWGPGGTSYLIMADELFGDTAEQEVWNKLATVLTDTYDGIPIRLALIDSGYRPGKKHQVPEHMVYRFCRRFPNLAFASKGASRPMRKPIAANKLDVKIDGRTFKKGVDIRILDTGFFKRWLVQKMRWPKDQPGGWFVPEDIDDDFLMQMTSEVEVMLASGKTKWVQRSKENHFWDCEAMQGAMEMMLNLKLLRPGPPMRRPERRSSPSSPSSPARDVEPSDSTEGKPQRRRRKGGFLQRESIW